MNDKIKPVFPYYCNKVLPVVYEDSLSYYEVLCKLTAKMNEIIESLNNADVGELIKKYLEKILNELLLDAMYDKSTETIYINGKTITANGDNHTYIYDKKTMKIGE